jgi:lysophospholipase L1-like esterase
MSALSLRYVALGDSMGVGVGARHGGYVEHLFQRLRRTRAGVGLLNLCMSGSTSVTVLSGQLPRAVRVRPHVVTLAIGANDVWRGLSPRLFEENLEQLARSLVSAGATVVLANLPDLSLAPVARLMPPWVYEGRVEAFNEAVDRVVTRHTLLGVDLYTPSRAELPHHPEYFSADGFHPSDTGYQRMAEHFWPGLLEAARRIGEQPAEAPER